MFINSNQDKTSGISASTWYNVNGLSLSVPIGAWKIGGQLGGTVTHAGITYLSVLVALSEASSSLSEDRWKTGATKVQSSQQQVTSYPVGVLPVPKKYDSATTIYLLALTENASTTLLRIETDSSIVATPAYL